MVFWALPLIVILAMMTVLGINSGRKTKDILKGYLLAVIVILFTLFNTSRLWIIWTTLIIIFLIQIAVIILNSIHDLRINLVTDDLPETGYEARINILSKEEEKPAKPNNFKNGIMLLVKAKFDNILYILEHEKHPVYLSLKNYDTSITKKLNVDEEKRHLMCNSNFLTTYYKDNYSLTTSPNFIRNKITRSPQCFIQVFKGASVEELLEKHLKAMEFLKSRGFEPEKILPEKLMEKIDADLRSIEETVKSHKFWHLKYILNFFVADKKLAMPVEEQFKEQPV